MPPKGCKGRSLWCLELLGDRIDEKDEDSEVECYIALVLAPVGGDRPITFERIGMVWSFGFRSMPVNAKGENWQEVEIVQLMLNHNSTSARC